MLLMFSGHMSRRGTHAWSVLSGMASNGFIVEVQRQQRIAGMHINTFADQVMGYRVEMVVILDVVINIDLHGFDIGVFVSLIG